MNYEEILYHYCPEFQLIDMLDWLQNSTGTEMNPIPTALDSKVAKNDEEPPH
jgi:hypothetical protein